MSKKVQVSFSDSQAELLNQLKGEFGETDADVVRGIVISWLAEKSFISTVAKHRIAESQRSATKEDRTDA